MSTYRTDEENDDDRRDEDEREREEAAPILRNDAGEPVRIHVVSWVNNTFWRVAVTVAVFASLFAIYDNGRRVDRLEGQVCETLVASESNLDTLAYYKAHPAEREAQRVRLRADMARFHCPDPRSPVVNDLSSGMGAITTGLGAVGIGRPSTSTNDR